ncbi:hypothetical protein B0A48_11735 [Cryoendolithus antarcticus]|uniref:DUF7730 domain-containing protein n=1 Tax=Cryoendolithus antarcticus TaxID=1507870 RepID=A0A1V8SSQ5_9PEZI|nr:hypothetical protein B0A48_11735 [Cryoendolithus antarcticus]
MAASTITPCIFTDRIPPEIRKMIFDHVLIRPEPFKFYRVFSPIQRVDGKRKGRWIAGKDTLGTKYAGLAYSRRAQAWVPKKPRHTALLQTCSTFHAEAVEVFYGSNSFVFSTSTEAMRVVESFGHAKASIRKIFIWDYVRLILSHIFAITYHIQIRSINGHGFFEHWHPNSVPSHRPHSARDSRPKTRLPYIKDGHIQFRRIFPNSSRNGGKAKCVISTNTRDFRHPGQIYDPQSKRWVKAPCFTGILRTCKLFAGEASVLYGSNSFVLHKVVNAQEFLDGIGSSKRFIRHLAIEKYWTPARSTFWQDISLLVNLRSLKIEHLWLERAAKRSWPTLKHRVLPLLKALRASYQQQGLPLDPVKTLCIGWEAPSWYNTGLCICGVGENCGTTCTWTPYRLAAAAGRASLVKGVEDRLRQALADEE